MAGASGSVSTSYITTFARQQKSFNTNPLASSPKALPYIIRTYPQLPQSSSQTTLQKREDLSHDLPSTFRLFPSLPTELQQQISSFACYPSQRSSCSHTHAHVLAHALAHAHTLRGLELNVGFLHPRNPYRDYDDAFYYDDSEYTLARQKLLSGRLGIVVEQAQNLDVPGCDDGAIDALYIYECRRNLTATIRTARQVVWEIWRRDIGPVEKETGLGILRRQRGSRDMLFGMRWGGRRYYGCWSDL